MYVPNIRGRIQSDLTEGICMRSAAKVAAVLLAIALGTPASAFDVQNSGGTPGSTGSANLAPDAAAGVSLDTDLKAQLGLSDEKTKNSLDGKSGLQFGGGVFSGSGQLNTTTMGYDESPWVAPRKPAGRD
jgi:hypothetical protein